MILSQKTISGKDISSLTRAQGYKEYVEVQCESCLNIRIVKYSSYLHLQYSNKNDGKTLCKSCGPKVKLGKIIDDQTARVIMQEYLNGNSMQKIANKFKKSVRKIREILTSRDVKLPKRNMSPKGFKKCWKCKISKQLLDFTDNGKCAQCCNSELAIIKKEKNLKRRPVRKLVNEWYFKKYSEQNGKCLICFNKFEKLSIDHCHSTGELRGLLCNFCNIGIGLFLEDVDAMEEAIAYLRESQDASK